MTDAEIVMFLEWLRRNYILAKGEVKRLGPLNTPTRVLTQVESVTNEAIAAAYAAHLKQ